jgi:glycogen debranching enzyme
VPLYPALFGRDALTAGWHASLLDRGAVLEAALSRLGRMQTVRDCAWTDEEPGRIPFQVRRGPLARLGENPFRAHYADFASPLMYVISMAEVFAWRGDERSLRAHLDTARRILDWARERGDRDGDGYLEYLTRSPMGPKNQAWKDSGRAIVDARGEVVPAPIAACEVQGYWFLAQELFALLLWTLGEREDARVYWASATALKERFDRDFWMEDEGFYGLALDPDKRLVRSVTSNVGHCLATGILPREKLPRVVARMFAPDLWSGWGIRTLSTEHPSYAPLSYHEGSVWSVESATIAFGLRRFGFDHRALELTEATLELASRFRGFRIPECVGGYSREELPHPGAYPQANTVQAWNASAIPMMLHVILGLLPLAPVRTLVVDPALPPSIDRVHLRGLRVGAASIDLLAWRDADGRSHFDVTRKEGTLHVVRQPPPESMSVGLATRMRAFATGVRAIP